MFSDTLSDFSAPWCQNLLNSPDLINTSTPTRRPEPPADRFVPNTLFSKTFKTDATIRAWQCLQAKHTDPSNASPTIFLLLSLGGDLNGYKGILHGGMFGILMDQIASICAGPTMMTAEMTLRYKKSVPLPSVVLCRSVVIKREGRKLWTQGRMENGTGEVYCEAESRHVMGKQERL